MSPNNFQSGKDTVLILGAMSDIGRAIAWSFGANGHPLQLAARSSARLERDAADLRIRFGVPVSIHEFDVLELEGHGRFLDALSPVPGIVVCVVGLLVEQQRVLEDPAAAELVMRTNYLGPALVLEAAAARFGRRGHGTVIGISSVAGERGRASNYVYGSAKAGLTAYLSGLRARMRLSGVRVITVKPGFVNTQMTADMAFPRPLTAQPDEVGAAVVAAYRKERDVVYVRPVWRMIMMAIRALPESVFKQVKF
jgi:decaprenylphospho-beta-D-erythro-pentofuranosid-2-ulose 2-reductase